MAFIVITIQRSCCSTRLAEGKVHQSPDVHTSTRRQLQADCHSKLFYWPSPTVARCYLTTHVVNGVVLQLAGACAQTRLRSGAGQRQPQPQPPEVKPKRDHDDVQGRRQTQPAGNCRLHFEALFVVSDWIALYRIGLRSAEIVYG